MSSDWPRSPGLRRSGQVFAWLAFVALSLTVLTTAWLCIRGAIAYQHLARVQSVSAASLSSMIADPTSAAAQITPLAADAKVAHDLTSDIIWRTAEHAPWVGPQLAAFATVASSIDEVVSNAYLPIARASATIPLDTLRPVDGRFDMTPLSALNGPSAQAGATASAAAEAVQSTDLTPLLPAVSSSVERAGDVLASSAVALDTLSRTAELLPQMINSTEPRNYLVLVQNNAEWRSLGGVTGTMLLLRVENGHLTLSDATSATSLTESIRGPVLDLPADIQSVYGTKPARYFHNLTQIPDFQTDGALAQQMYKTATGVLVDGVFTVDPVVLSYILQSVGSVTLPNGDSLTAENVVPELLNNVYLRFEDPQQQDEYFASATGAVFDALIAGRGTPTGLVAALWKAGSEHRFMMWSSRPEEQLILEGTTVAGPLPISDSSTLRFGAFLNDGTGSKMSYYVEPVIAAQFDNCESRGDYSLKRISVTIELSNHAPIDASTALPWYITGGGKYGVPPGTARVVGNVYLPPGFSIDSSQSTDSSALTKNVVGDHQVVTFATDISPQSSQSITFTVEGLSSAGEAKILATPTADKNVNPIVDVSCSVTPADLAGRLR